MTIWVKVSVTESTTPPSAGSDERVLEVEEKTLEVADKMFHDEELGRIAMAAQELLFVLKPTNAEVERRTRPEVEDPLTNIVTKSKREIKESRRMKVTRS